MLRALFASVPERVGFASVAKGIPPISEFCSGENAYDFLRGLGLAHMDSHLKQDGAARDFLAGDLEAHLAGRGVKVEVV